MSTHYQGETVVIEVSVTDTDRAATNPTTSITISISDPGGNAMVTDAAMTNDSTGKYHYDYAIPADATIGEWDAEVTASSGKPSIERCTFRVEAKL